MSISILKNLIASNQIEVNKSFFNFIADEGLDNSLEKFFITFIDKEVELMANLLVVNFLFLFICVVAPVENPIRQSNS